jgi:hypothetical protein
MASHNRETLASWPINWARDLADAIDEAEGLVTEDGGPDADLSFILMTAANQNVEMCRLIKIDLTDSYAYELELA